MKIESNTANYYSLFNRNNQRGQLQQQTIDVSNTSVRQSGLSATTATSIPSSIASTMWTLQSGSDMSITPQTEKEKAAAARHDALVDEFSKWSNMNPAEYIRAKYLEAHGLTEESLAAMPEDERAAIEKEIADQIKEQLAKKKENGAQSDQTPLAS